MAKSELQSTIQWTDTIIDRGRYNCAESDRTVELLSNRVCERDSRFLEIEVIVAYCCRLWPAALGPRYLTWTSPYTHFSSPLPPSWRFMV
jgi:hypothetical protein